MANVARELAFRLPVLLYHRIAPPRPGTPPSLTISPEQFEGQVRWLARRGYVGIRASDWRNQNSERNALAGRRILITFDDGYSETAEQALPILRRHGFSAAIYIVTGQIAGTNAWDEANYSDAFTLMSTEQIRHWATEGFEFGAHTRTHRDLTTLSPRELEQEIIGSRDDLARILGVVPCSFAYPYGHHNARVRACAREAFSLALTCDEGINHATTDALSLRRTMVLPGDSLADLECRIRLGWSPLSHARARMRLRSRLRAILGQNRCSNGLVD